MKFKNKKRNFFSFVSSAFSSSSSSRFSRFSRSSSTFKSRRNDDDEFTKSNDSWSNSFFDSSIKQFEKSNLWQNDFEINNITFVSSINVTTRSNARDARKIKRMIIDYMLNVQAFTRQIAFYKINVFKKIAKIVKKRSQNAQYFNNQKLQALILWKTKIVDNITIAFANVKNVKCFKKWLKTAKKRKYDKNISKQMTIEMIKIKLKLKRFIFCDFAEQKKILASNKQHFSLIWLYYLYLQIRSDCKQKWSRKIFYNIRLRTRLFLFHRIQSTQKTRLSLRQAH